MALHTTTRLSLEEIVTINTSITPVVAATNLPDALANRVFSPRNFVDANGRSNFQRLATYLMARHPQERLVTDINLFDPSALLQYIDAMIKIGIEDCFEPNGELKAFLSTAIQKYVAFDPTDINAKRTVLRQYLFATVDLMAEKITSDELFKPLLTVAAPTQAEHKTTEGELREEVRAYLTLIDHLIANALGMAPRNIKKLIPTCNSAYRLGRVSFGHDTKDLQITPDMCHEALKKGKIEMAFKHSTSTVLNTLDWWPVQFGFTQLKLNLSRQFDALPQPLLDTQRVSAILAAAMPELRWLDSAILALQSPEGNSPEQIKFAAQYKSFTDSLDALHTMCAKVHPADSAEHRVKLAAIESFRARLATDNLMRVDLGERILQSLQVAQDAAIAHRVKLLAELDRIEPKPNWLDDKSVLMYFSRVKAWSTKIQFTSDLAVDMQPHLKAALNLYLLPQIEALATLDFASLLNLQGKGLLSSPAEEKEGMPLVKCLVTARITQLVKATARLIEGSEHGTTTQKSHSLYLPQLSNQPLPDSTLKPFSLGGAALTVPQSFAANVKLLRHSNLFERIKSSLEAELAKLKASSIEPTPEMLAAWKIVTQTSSKSPEKLLVEVSALLAKATATNPFLQQLHRDLLLSLNPEASAAHAAASVPASNHRGSLKDLAAIHRRKHAPSADSAPAADVLTGEAVTEPNPWELDTRRRSDTSTLSAAQTKALLAFRYKHDRSQSDVPQKGVVSTLSGVQELPVDCTAEATDNEEMGAADRVGVPTLS